MRRRTARRAPRGSTAERGYGSEHEKLRAEWKPLVDAGQAWCAETVCVNPGGRWIKPGTPWHLAHKTDRSGYKGPAHEGCNCADGGRRSRSRRPKRKQAAGPATPLWPTSRSW